MKKIVAICILFCLAVPFAGTYTWLHYEKRKTKKAIKRKMIAGIDKSELVLLKFAKTDVQSLLRWEHSKEFEFKGEMYDVVGTETYGDSITYLCWWDYEETNLNLELHSLVAKAMGDNPGQKEKQTRLVDFLKSLYCTTVQNEATAYHEIKTELIYPAYKEGYTAREHAPPAPPPWFRLQIR